MPSILIIEDDKLLRTMIGGAMRKSGYEVFEAGNGNEGLAVLEKSGAPDVVLTDILMPDKEGLETISEICGSYPDIKIIAMSGGGATKNMMFLKMAETIGAHKILEKPFKPEDLIDAIEDIAGD